MKTDFARRAGVIPKTMEAFVFLLMILMFAGCDTTLTGYPFKSRAVYHASRSNVSIAVEAEGFVPAGADVSGDYRGTVRAEPLSAEGRDVDLVFRDDRQVDYRIESGVVRMKPWGFRESESSLTEILTEAGYPTIDAQEVEEIVRAIGGVFAGPKGTILGGQTTLLKVVLVDSGKK